MYFIEFIQCQNMMYKVDISPHVVWFYRKESKFCFYATKRCFFYASN